MTSRLLISLIVYSIFAPAIEPSNAALIIAPDVPHFRYNGVPFGFAQFNTIRYQQVYASSIFSGNGPLSIGALAFSPRVDDTVEGDVTIRLGLTKKDVNGLDTVLDNNATDSLTVVFSDPTFIQAVTGGSETFSLRFDFFDRPFAYDPTGGQNLLLDIMFHGTGPDMSRGSGTGFSSRAYAVLDTGAVNADGAFLRTQVQFATVSEPKSLTIWFVIASIGLVVLSHHRKKWGCAQLKRQNGLTNA